MNLALLGQGLLYLLRSSKVYGCSECIDQLIMKDKKNDIVVMDFTGAYDEEAFAQRESVCHVDCRKVRGTDCYCDAEAAFQLRKMMAAYPVHGIHFIDSGNYHYLTKLWTDRIREPFSLIVFDHHPDMQSPAFPGLLSCGGWVKRALDTNPYLQKVVIIGAADALVHQVPAGYEDRVRFYTEGALEHASTWEKFKQGYLQEPVYISIDKDVLNTHAAITNWDQGSMTLSELRALLQVILQKEEVLGVDICGEFKPSSNVCLDQAEADEDSKANAFLLRLFKEDQEHKEEQSHQEDSLTKQG